MPTFGTYRYDFNKISHFWKPLPYPLLGWGEEGEWGLFPFNISGNSFIASSEKVALSLHKNVKIWQIHTGTNFINFNAVQDAVTRIQALKKYVHVGYRLSDDKNSFSFNFKYFNKKMSIFSRFHIKKIYCFVRNNNSVRRNIIWNQNHTDN